MEPNNTLKTVEIVNLHEGTLLKTKELNAVIIKQIEVDDTGNKAFAIVGYPNPGVGYILAKFNDETDAHKEFYRLITYASEDRIYLNSVFTQPEPLEPVDLGLAQLSE